MNLSNQFGLPDADGYYHFNLSNGGSVKIEDILYGYHYEVIEVPQDDWSLESSENTTGTMSKDSTATFTNKKDISLTIKKETDSDINEEFEFKVKLWKEKENLDLSSQFGEPDADGYYHFNLYSGEQSIIKNIPYGYQYKVYEIDKDGNEVAVNDIFNDKWQLVSATNTSGTLTESKTSVFTNNIKKGTIDVEKETKGNEAGEFNFKIRLKKSGVDEQEPPGNTMFFIGPKFKGFLSKNLRGSLSWDSVTIDDNKVSEGVWEYSFKLNNGENLSFTDIPYGTAYEIWEETPEGWELVSIDGVTPRDKAEGTVNKNSVEHVFLNAKKKTLTFEKEVTGGFGDTNKEFEFEVKVYNETQTIDLTSYGGVDGGSGIYTFKLKHGETVTIPDIPYGYAYEIKEKDYTADQYTTKVDGVAGRQATGTLTEDKSHVFTNNKKETPPTGVNKNFIVLPLVILVLLTIFIIRKRQSQIDTE